MQQSRRWFTPRDYVRTTFFALSLLVYFVYMTQKPEELYRWQKRLEDAFAGPNGICGERGVELGKAEGKHLSELLSSTHGYTRLMDAFFDFFLQTLNEAHDHTPQPKAIAYAMDVHHSESSIVEIINQFMKEKGTHLLPHADAERASSFVNVSHFAAWCCVRILPFISKPRLFTDDWKERYRVLDDSFAFFNKGFTGHLAELGEAYEHFIERQLTFPIPSEL